MKSKTSVLAFVLIAGSALTLAAQEQKLASIGNFKLENGETIQNCKIGYRTIGELNPAKSNAILFPTWFTGTTKPLVGLVGPGKLVDSSKYFVILVDALGDGVSSSPSNSTAQPHMSFPRFTILDMVNAEHELAVRILNLHHVHAVMGISMGGMQTFQWITAYPDFMDEAIPMVGSPKLTSYDLLLWTIEEQAIEMDPAWKGGDYNSVPKAGMSLVGEIHTMNLTTPEYRVQHTTPQQFSQFLKATDEDTMKSFDANDWIRQLQAMMADDVSKPFGGSMEKAATAVRAKVLVVVSKQDHMVNPTPALHFAKLLKAPVVELTSDCGHISTGCQGAALSQSVESFLAK
jgi:homoserine O-acetyltransferase